jgi:DNA polymerase
MTAASQYNDFPGACGIIRSVPRPAAAEQPNRRLPSPAVPTKTERREALKAVFEQARGCVKCPQLASSRQNVVFGAGNADADLMFVGEAPGANEDRQGLPFVGQAGKLLDKLLGDIGMARSDVFVGNVLKCRPPGNRDPQPVEIENCQGYLMRQIELIEPRVICTLGNFATKLLRGEPTGITRVHGQAEVRVIGTRAVRLYPLFHPAAALYTPSTLQTLGEDFARIPDLLALDPPEQPEPLEVPELPVEPVVRAMPSPGSESTPPGTSAPPAGPGGPEPAVPEPAASAVPEPALDPQLGLF